MKTIITVNKASSQFQTGESPQFNCARDKIIRILRQKVQVALALHSFNLLISSLWWPVNCAITFRACNKIAVQLRKATTKPAWGSIAFFYDKRSTDLRKSMHMHWKGTLEKWCRVCIQIWVRLDASVEIGLCHLLLWQCSCLSKKRQKG